MKHNNSITIFCMAILYQYTNPNIDILIKHIKILNTLKYKRAHFTHHEITLAEHCERTLTLLTKFHFEEIICITCVFHNLLSRVSAPTSSCCTVSNENTFRI